MFLYILQVTSQGPLQTRLFSFLGAKLHFPEAISSAERALSATGGLGKPEDAAESFLARGPTDEATWPVHPEMARRQDEARMGAPLRAEGRPDAEVKLILYHWTHSFSSQKVTARSRGPRSGSAPGQLPRRGAGPDPGCLHCWGALSVDPQEDEESEAGTVIQEAPLRSITFTLEVLPTWALDPGEWGRKKCLPATLWATFLL